MRSRIDSTPLVERIDQELCSRIVQESREALASFVGSGDKTAIPIEGHLIVTRTR